MITLSIRLPDNLNEKIERLAKTSGKSKNKIVVEILTGYLGSEHFKAALAANYELAGSGDFKMEDK